MLVKLLPHLSHFKICLSEIFTGLLVAFMQDCEWIDLICQRRVCDIYHSNNKDYIYLDNFSCVLHNLVFQRMVCHNAHSSMLKGEKIFCERLRNGQSGTDTHTCTPLIDLLNDNIFAHDANVYCRKHVLYPK